MPNSHYLKALLEPQSIAVVGASEKADAIGNFILKNLTAGGYKGKLWAVNPKYQTVLGQPCVAALDKIGARVDLAIITTAPRTIAPIIEQCGRAGIHQAIVVSNLANAGAASATLERRVLDAARNHGVRLLGAKSLGIIRPRLRLNATFTEITAAPGDLALVAQSGAMCAAVLDWAAMNRIGISSVVALGTAMDVDFGEILDYLVYDDQTRYILLHVERIRHSRRFMSALRSAARVKPVILLKSGGDADAAGGDDPSRQQAESGDSVFDAAVRRAGVVRVRSISQLFYAAKALASGFHPRGNRLAILSNGTGPGAMAADCAREQGVPLARLAPESVTAMKAFLPPDWGGEVPIDLGGDADPERYRQTILALARDTAVDATLVVLSPLAMAQPEAVAKGIVEIAASQRLTLCCCFMGGEQIAAARRILEDAGIPVFRTPDTVIGLFHNISKYYRNQKLLLQAPSPSQNSGRSGSGSARALVEALLGEKRRVLSAMEAKSLLRSFGIPVVSTMVAHSATEAMFVAEQVGLPVTLQIDAPNLPHRLEEGERRQNVGNTESVRNAFHDLVDALRQSHPDLRVNGVTVEPYQVRPHGRELMVGVLHDPVFGPVISFGAGGHNVEIFRDRAVSLPPLNRFLARDLIDSTRVAKTLEAFRQFPAADRDALEAILLAVSNLVCELPWIRELEINPLIVDETGAVATDARIVIDQALGTGIDRYGHMAIHPYPAHLCQEWPMGDGTVIAVRPVRPEDAALEQEFVRSMSEESRRYRFMDSTHELPPNLIVRFTQVDYDREMALLAVINEDGREKEVGNARYAQTPDGESVEFALAVGDRWQKCGLGRRLMGALIDCARAKAYRTMVGDVLADNKKMLGLMKNLGFAILPHPEENTLKRVVKELNG